LKKVLSTEATAYIKKGRETTYEYIDLLYRKDWKFDTKQNGVKVYTLTDTSNSSHYLRTETKYEDIEIPALIEYFTNIDKRMAWETNYESIEEIRTYPLDTKIFYFKLKQGGTVWSSGAAKDSLILTHGVEMMQNRGYYLTALSVEHEDFPQQKKITRVESKMISNYFEPTADGRGVKNIFIVEVTPAQSTLSSFTSSPSNTSGHQNLNAAKDINF